MMYVLMFIAAWKLKSKFAHLKRPFAIPGKKTGYYLTCILGLCGCTMTLIVGFIPPVEFMNFGSASHFRLVFSMGIAIMMLPAFLLYWRKKHLTKSED